MKTRGTKRSGIRSAQHLKLKKGIGDGMIRLPASTKVNKSIPKEILSKYLNSSVVLTRSLIDEIISMVWTHQLSPETMAVRMGKNVAEIAVIEIVLTRQANSQILFEILNREIDQFTVFIVRYEEWGQLWCGSRETGNSTDEWSLKTYNQTSWMPYEELVLNVQGPDLDQIYKNFIMQITGVPVPLDHAAWVMADEITAATESDTETADRLEKLTAAASELENQLGNEKTFNRQLQLMRELRSVKAEMQLFQSAKTKTVEMFQPEMEGLPLDNLERIKVMFPNVVIKMEEG